MSLDENTYDFPTQMMKQLLVWSPHYNAWCMSSLALCLSLLGGIGSGADFDFSL